MFIFSFQESFFFTMCMNYNFSKCKGLLTLNKTKRRTNVVKHTGYVTLSITLSDSKSKQENVALSTRKFRVRFV